MPLSELQMPHFSLAGQSGLWWDSLLLAAVSKDFNLNCTRPCMKDGLLKIKMTLLLTFRHISFVNCLKIWFHTIMTGHLRITIRLIAEKPPVVNL